MEQSWERSSAPLPYFGVVAIKKGAFGSLSTIVANFTLLIWYQVFLFLVLKIYKSLRSHFEYCTQVQTSMFRHGNWRVIFKGIQRRVTKIIKRVKNYSYHERLEKFRLWLEKRLDGNYTRMLWAILKKSWRQHPTHYQMQFSVKPRTFLGVGNLTPQIEDTISFILSLVKRAVQYTLGAVSSWGNG